MLNLSNENRAITCRYGICELHLRLLLVEESILLFHRTLQNLNSLTENRLLVVLSSH